jgi:hypothetical protein
MGRDAWDGDHVEKLPRGFRRLRTNFHGSKVHSASTRPDFNADGVEASSVWRHLLVLAGEGAKPLLADVGHQVTEQHGLDAKDLEETPSVGLAGRGTGHLSETAN